MKFQPDTLDGANVISRHEPGRIWVNGAIWSRSVVVPARGAAVGWAPQAFEALRVTHFEDLLCARPEVVIFGSGVRLRFPPMAVLRALIERRIGVETMDTAAACRTYNVLAAEGRLVVAALLLEGSPGTGPA